MYEGQFQLIVFDGYIIAMLVLGLGNSWAFCFYLKIYASCLYKRNLISLCCSCNLNTLRQALFKVHNLFLFSGKKLHHVCLIKLIASCLS